MLVNYIFLNFIGFELICLFDVYVDRTIKLSNFVTKTVALNEMDSKSYEKKLKLKIEIKINFARIFSQ
jgi:hypothetical protein